MQLVSCSLVTEENRHRLHVLLKGIEHPPPPIRIENIEDVRTVLEALNVYSWESHRPDRHTHHSVHSGVHEIIFPVKKVFTPLENLPIHRMNEQNFPRLSFIERIDAARIAGEHAVKEDVPLLSAMYTDTKGFPKKISIVNHFLYPALKTSDQKVERALKLEGGFLCLILKKCP